MNVWLTVHLIGAVLFAGNIVTAAFWKIRADYRRDPAVIQHAVKNVMLADYAFTLPGLILIIVSGVAMAVREDWPMSGFNWLTLSVVLLAITGVVWLAVLVPMQRRMIRLSASCVEGGKLSPAYRQASRIWAIFGTAATLLPIVILYFMVAKSF